MTVYIHSHFHSDYESRMTAITLHFAQWLAQPGKSCGLTLAPLAES